MSTIAQTAERMDTAALEDFARLLWALDFRPERSRPIWVNRHTGSEVVVVDLDVNDRGGPQGGCIQHVVVTNEAPPPGPPPVPDARREFRGPRGVNTHSLGSFVRNWRPTGRHADWPLEDDAA